MKASTHSIRRFTTGDAGPRERWVRRTTLAVALAAAGMTAIASSGSSGLPDASPLIVDQAAVQAPASLAGLIERVKPAVVNVAVGGKASVAAKSGTPDLKLPDEPMFRDFFERFFRHSPSLPDALPSEPGPPRDVRGLGSGFIVSPDGHVVTSHHVAEAGSEIHVILNDGQRLKAQVKGVDPKTDLALLKIETDDELPYVAFGDSDGARPGDWVVAIGNPFGLGGTATTGIISARGRDIQSGPYDDYLQIDAPINRGNSGGPLFDLAGRVVGVNTAIYSPNGGNVGIGFAVPATQARSVIEQLMASGHVERGWLGVQIQALTEALAESLQLPDTRGALVSSVTLGSPAARAGIQVGDVILAFEDQEVTEMRNLPRLVADVAPGRHTGVTVWRQGKELDLEVSVGAAPYATAQVAEGTARPADGGKLGLALAPMTEALRQRFDVARGLDGALVVDVEDDSPAARQGLRPGDIIVQAGGRQVTMPDDVFSAVTESYAEESDTVLLLVNRQGDQHFVAVRIG
jgi:serine protease Do